MEIKRDITPQIKFSNNKIPLKKEEQKQQKNALSATVSDKYFDSMDNVGRAKVGLDQKPGISFKGAEDKLAGPFKDLSGLIPVLQKAPGDLTKAEKEELLKQFSQFASSVTKDPEREKKAVIAFSEITSKKIKELEAKEKNLSSDEKQLLFVLKKEQQDLKKDYPFFDPGKVNIAFKGSEQSRETLGGIYKAYKWTRRVLVASSVIASGGLTLPLLVAEVSHTIAEEGAEAAAKNAFKYAAKQVVDAAVNLPDRAVDTVKRFPGTIERRFDSGLRNSGGASTSTLNNDIPEVDNFEKVDGSGDALGFGSTITPDQAGDFKNFMDGLENNLTDPKYKEKLHSRIKNSLVNYAKKEYVDIGLNFATSTIPKISELAHKSLVEGKSLTKEDFKNMAKVCVTSFLLTCAVNEGIAQEYAEQIKEINAQNNLDLKEHYKNTEMIKNIFGEDFMNVTLKQSLDDIDKNFNIDIKNPKKTEEKVVQTLVGCGINVATDFYFKKREYKKQTRKS